MQTNTSGLPTNYAIYIPAFLRFNFGVDFQVLNQIAAGGTSKIYMARPIAPSLVQVVGNDQMVAKLSTRSFTQMQASEQQAFYQELSLLQKFRDVPSITKLHGFCGYNEAVMLIKCYPNG